MTTVDEHQVRLTAHEAQANLRTMLELCSAGRLRCSEKTGRPASATVASVAAHLVRGDFYRGRPESLRVTVRSPQRPQERFPGLGFRCASDLD